MRGAALSALLVVGCAHSHATARPGPDTTLAAWRAAVARNDAHAAYGLLSSSLRAHLSEPDFALQWKAAQADLSAQEEALHAPATIKRATGETDDGRAWPLVREEQRWRVAAAHPLEVGGDTPEDAVRRLIAAVEARDFDAVLGLLADPERSIVEEALADRVHRLKAALRRGGIEASGNTARIRYDPRYHLDLVQENGRWRIADFN